MMGPNDLESGQRLRADLIPDGQKKGKRTATVAESSALRSRAGDDPVRSQRSQLQ